MVIGTQQRSTQMTIHIRFKHNDATYKRSYTRNDALERLYRRQPGY